jgi:GntR family transcriptional regulator
MARASSKAEQARSVLRDAIRSGRYPPGAKLPSTRELAAQFQINRNTALKIYHELASDQLIEIEPHRPPIVIGDNGGITGANLRDRIRESLQPYFLESRLMGMPPDDMRRMLGGIADELLGTYQPQAIFVAECNSDEARFYAQELTMKLGSIVQPILLDQLTPNLPADIIVTPYFHLQEARQRLGETRANVAGMMVTADSSDVARAVSMVENGPVGVVAVHRPAAQRLRRLLGFQLDVPMITATSDSRESVIQLLDQVECVVCTVRAYGLVRQFATRTPVALVQYHADDQSVELLRREMQRISA